MRLINWSWLQERGRGLQKLKYYLCSHCLGGSGWLIEKGKWGLCLPAKDFILPCPSWVPGVWTLCGPHLLLCSNKAGILQSPPLTPPSRCSGRPEHVNPAAPICPATCLLVFKYLPATSPLLKSNLKLLPPTCLQLPTQCSPRVTPKVTMSHFCWLYVTHRGESVCTLGQVG